MTAPTLINRFVNEYHFLSNFYASPVIFDGLLYPTVEHAFQAGKSLNDEFRESMAYRTETPNKAKAKGRSVKLRSDWETIKIPHMRLLVSKKFKIPALRKFLLATGDAELVEGNTWGDDFWGTVDGKGKNHLGIILMEVREDIAVKRDTIKISNIRKQYG